MAEPESRVDTREGRRLGEALDRLAKAYPEPYLFLDAEDPFQLLIAVMLSAQCTDEQVNKTTPGLFTAYPTAQALAAAPRDDVERLIYSTGFYKTKAKHIQETARRIVEDHGGEVPRSMDALTALPGVARKTANVVQWHAFGLINGVTVDTHVKRLSTRLGLTDAKSPAAIERHLMELLPKRRWPDLTYYFISHGRAVCDARKPLCDACSLADICPSAGEA